MAKTSPRRIALCPGSFDPITLGHTDVIARAARLFDKLVIGVIENPSKASLFTAEERVDLIRGELERHSNIVVKTFSGLAVQAAAQVGARWIVRGLRSAADALYELPMAHSNRKCGEVEIETVFLAASADVSFVSSTLVREIAARGGHLEAFVTPAVEKALTKKFS